jgi:NAD(P)-dependent dehydrogenase (short-subunit alcohol dehydrogenase family)
VFLSPKTKMPTFTNKLAGKKVVIIGGSSGSALSFSMNNSSRIGFGVAEALVSLEAHVIIISSSKDKVDNALDRLRKSAPENSRVEGIAQSATDSTSVIQVLKDLGPFDHLVYTAAQFSSLKSGDLDSLKDAFDVKFWGAVNAATGYIRLRSS